MSNEKPATQIVAGVIKKLTASVNTLGFSKVRIAIDLDWAQHVVNWTLTKYGSWHNFCDQEILLSMSTISRYTLIARLIKKFDYTQAEAEEMVAGVGWNRFFDGLMLMKRKLKPSSFIDRYKNLSTDQTIPRKGRP
ncbi:MAG: hypothetical protein KJO60_11550, partial [Desulfofustis sp.]|nr:hypothetical protein [Desulfofustis sp.]